MMLKRSALAGLCAMCAAVSAIPAGAEAGRPQARRAQAAEVARARAFVKAGSALFDAGDFAGSLASYQKAEPHGVALGDPAGIRWNIARCLEELGRAQQAVAAFDRYLELPDSPEGHADARRRMAQIERTALGGIAVTCNETGARVRPVYSGTSAAGALDERSCPERWRRLQPGAYRVVGVSLDGRASAAEVDVIAGEDAAVVLAFEPALRGGLAPMVGASDALAQPEVAAVQASEPSMGPSGGSSALTWVALGTGVAAAVAGTVLLVQAGDRFDEAEQAYDRYRAGTDGATLATARADAQSGLEDGRTYRTAGYVLLGVGALGAGLATWLFFDGDSAPVSVNMGPEGASLGWVGQW